MITPRQLFEPQLHLTLPEVEWLRWLWGRCGGWVGGVPREVRGGAPGLTPYSSGTLITPRQLFDPHLHLAGSLPELGSRPEVEWLRWFWERCGGWVGVYRGKHVAARRG